MNSPVRLKPSYWFALISFCYLGLTISYSLITPPFQSIDEHSHFLYIVGIMKHWQLPTMEDGSLISPLQHQAPLYYLLGAATGSIVNWSGFGRLADASQMATVFHTARWLSVLFGLLAVVATYQLSRLVFTRRAGLGLIATAVVAFNPSFISLTSAVSNDSLLFALSAFVLLGIISIGRSQKLSPKVLALTGIALGLAALTKLTALVFVPPLAVAIAFAAWRNKSWREFLTGQSIAFGIGIVIGGWFYARNFILYRDPIAWGLISNLNPGEIRPNPLSITNFPDYLMTEAQTFWAAFGYVSNIRLPLIVYAAIFVIVGLSVLGLLALLTRHLKKGLAWSSPSSVTYILLLLCIITNFAGVLYFARSFLGAWHGRFLFPNVGGISILIVAGLAFLLSARKGFILAILPVGLLALAILSLPIYVAPLRVTPDILSTDDAKMTGNNADVAYDGKIQLIGYQLNPGKVKPGDQLEAVLYWKAIDDIDTDWTFFIHVVDTEGNMLVGHDGRPLDGMHSTFFWRKGEIWRGHYDIAIDSSAHDGLYRLNVGMYDLLTFRHAKVVQDGVLLKRNSAIMGEIKVSSHQFKPASQHPLVVDFQDNIRLLGWDWGENRLTLYWEALGKPSKSYAVFAHLLNNSGALVEQHDSIPASNAFPTDVWEKGDYIADEHNIICDVGEYMLEIGLYDLKTMERLPTKDGHDRLLLGKVKVSR